MTPVEKRTTLSLASIYAFRMLGLFMILPIFSLYVHHFKHANAILIGMALGIYGLTQACLQIPFGMASDRLGRKPIIVAGLILFAIGSVLAALSHSIYGIILGRALQGSGAIGSTLTALVADNTAEENRLKAMSMIGMTIGLSFIGAMILGPILDQWVGLSGIFWLTALLAVIGILALLVLVPTPKNHMLHRDSGAVWGQFRNMLRIKELLRLDFGIMAQHCMLTALFIVVPIVLVNQLQLPVDQQWKLYLPVLLLSFVLMVPFVIIAESKRKMKSVFVGAVVVLTLTQFALWFTTHSVFLIAFILLLFFAAFTLLEAILPSLVAKIAPAGSKGTAMGIYSTSQFLGIFIGGSLSGVIYHHFGLHSVFLFCGIIGLIWIMVAITMKKPQHLSSKIIVLKTVKDANALQAKLLKIKGVADANVCPDEQVAYLKVDKKLLDETALNKLI